MMQKKKNRLNYRRLIALVILCSMLIVLIVAAILLIVSLAGKEKAKPASAGNDNSIVVYKDYDFSSNSESQPENIPLLPQNSDEAFDFGNEIVSCNGILVDCETNTVIARRNPDERIYPASLTKVMTLIVAVEHIDSLEATFTMSDEILSPLFSANASLAGFQSGEVCTLQDLVYGMILPSGAEASAAIAEYVCGSEEAFVSLMNQKTEELGLDDTHFTNTSGLHNEAHYTTAREMAVILRYAMDNEFCREVLTTFQYTTAKTEQNPDGILLTSDLFSRMYGDEAEGFTILGGKTGFTNEAGHCLATFAKNNSSGKEYILILCGAQGTKWNSVSDTEAVYEYLNSSPQSATTTTDE